MNEAMKDVTSVAMAIVGVAILGVIFVTGGRNSPAIISTAGNSFANVLGVAMGGAPMGGAGFAGGMGGYTIP